MGITVPNTMGKGLKWPSISLVKVGSTAAVAALLLAGCSSASNSTSSNTNTAAAASGATAAVNNAAAASNGKNVCVIGGADAFFAVVKNGADAAGAAVKAAGSNYTWIPLATYDNIGPDMVKLIQQAVSQKCTVLSLPDWSPDAENPAIADAKAKGIAVFLYNAGGEEQVKATSALGYFGTDEFLAGKKAGEYFGTNGSKNVICVNTSPGSVNIEARCNGTNEGLKASGGKSTQLVLPGKSFGDAAAISAAVKGALSKDPTIDGVITIASGDADAVASSVKAANSKAKQGSFDVSENILGRIQSGEAMFAVDQQGWLQGWLSTSAAWQYDSYGILPATNIILTGPALITKDNVDTIVAGVKTGQR